MKTSLEMREKRATLVKESRQYIDKASEEKRELTPEEDEAVDKLLAAVDKLGTQIDRLEKLENAEDEDEAPAERSGRSMPPESRTGNQGPSVEQQVGAYRHWLRCGEVGK